MKIFLRIQLFIIIIGLSALGQLLFLYFTDSFYEKSVRLGSVQAVSTQQATNAVALLQQGQTSNGSPTLLKIPKLDVDATIEYVGLTSKGAMDVPKEPQDVAWFNQGPRPGEKGSAVIAGHLDSKNGKAAVFYDLHKLRKGDELQVVTDKGISISFVVRESRLYDAGASPPEVFGSANGTHLNLITCVGVWDKSKQSYAKRLVVFTDIVL